MTKENLDSYEEEVEAEVETLDPEFLSHMVDDEDSAFITFVDENKQDV